MKIKDVTFGQISEYVKKNCPFSNGKMKIEILGANSCGWECVVGLPTNDARSVILQGTSDKVLEQEIDFNVKSNKDTEIAELKTALELACVELEKCNKFAQDETTRKIISLDSYFIDKAKKELKVEE